MIQNLLKTIKTVHIITWNNKEYDRRASMLEIALLKNDSYCKVIERDDEITLDFRRGND